MSTHFEIVQSDPGELGQPWHTRLVSANGNAILASETYTRRASAENAVAVAAEAFGISMSRPPHHENGSDRLIGVPGNTGYAQSYDVRYVDERTKVKP